MNERGVALKIGLSFKNGIMVVGCKPWVHSPLQQLLARSVQAGPVYAPSHWAEQRKDQRKESVIDVDDVGGGDPQLHHQ